MQSKAITGIKRLQNGKIKGIIEHPVSLIADMSIGALKAEVATLRSRMSKYQSSFLRAHIIGAKDELKPILTNKLKLVDRKDENGKLILAKMDKGRYVNLMFLFFNIGFISSNFYDMIYDEDFDSDDHLLVASW